MRDRKFIRQYRDWLKQYCSLYDCAYDEKGVWQGWRDVELEELRNCRGLGYVERDVEGLRWPQRMYRSSFQPTYDDFGSHLDRDYDFTIFHHNSCGSDDPLLVLADIDNKSGRGDVDGAVEHLVEEYRFTSHYIEPSSHFLGRHLYFLLDTEISGMTYYEGRDDIWRTMTKFTTLIQADPIWKGCGVSFDGFFGMPTIWNKVNGQYVVNRRGTALKLPRVLDGHYDLDRLMRLSKNSMSLERLQHALKSVALPKTASNGVVEDRKRSLESRENGWTKKKHLVGTLLRQQDGIVSEEQVETAYMTGCNPTAATDTPRDVKRRRAEIQRCVRVMTKQYGQKKDRRQYPFCRDQFLPIIENLVPWLALQVKFHNRSKISHRHLSDFVSLKVADAFYVHPKKKTEWFAQTLRDTTIANSRKLKEAGVLDWVVTTNTYSMLLRIARKYHLLEVFRPHVRPLFDGKGKKVRQGAARLIGPGRALATVRPKWMPLYQKWSIEMMNQTLAA